jgi:TonB-dependent receptor
MFELPIMPRVTAVTGLRYEKTWMFTENHAVPIYKRTGTLSEKDILPALNLVVQVAKDMNLRLSYGKTLARPSMREFAPFFSQEYNSGYILNGNPDLERTLIDNYDVRWEWFARAGELIALSYFHKNLENPIERAVIDHNKNVKYLNVEDASVRGFELELRKQLDEVHSLLRHFQIGLNWAIVKSQVALPASDYHEKMYRPLQGQSPYLLNVDFGYNNPRNRTSLNMVYSVFGKRLGDLSLRKIEHPYEMPRHMLDMTFSQKIWRGLSLKASAKNILGARYKRLISDEGNEYVEKEHELARTFSVGTTFEF